MTQLAPDPIADAEDFAKRTTDALVGMRVPRDDEPAYVVRCLYGAQTMPRYYYATSGSYGPITVALHHATRYPTKVEALVALAMLRARGGVPWRLARLSRPSARALPAAGSKR